MSEYRSFTQIEITGGTPESEIGHLIGTSVVITRIIEYLGAANKDAIKTLAELLLKSSLNDIDRQISDKSANAKQAAIKEHAREAVRQILIPLTDIQNVQ